MSDWLTDYYNDVDGMRLQPFVDRHTDDAIVQFANFPPSVGKEAIGAAIGGFWSTIAGLRHVRRNLWFVNDGNTAVFEALLHYKTKGGAEVALPCVSLLDRAADGLGDHEAHPALRPGAADGVHHQRRTSRTDPRPGHATEVGRLVQTRRTREHRERGGGAQAESLARPLPRRAERIARPARVRIRSRKPWVRLRRRLLGWKVRLLTGGLPRCS